MAVKFTKPEINVREKLAELDKPSGIAGEAMLRAETPQEQFNLIGAGRRNLIINGGMRVAQRGTTGTLNNGGGGFHSADRFLSQEEGAFTGAFIISNDSDSPKGFSNSTKWDCTTADTSLAAADSIFVDYKPEAQDLQHLNYGTPDALQMTASFWIKSNKTGTYVLWLYQYDDGRQVSAPYTINSADTWEYKTLLIPADPTGVIDNNNGAGLVLRFVMGSGSNQSSGTTPSAWESLVEANRYAGQTVNLADSTSNYMNITGIQLEIGKIATPFEHRSYGEELALCQRYYQRGISNGALGVSLNSTLATFGFRLAVEMRTEPTVSLISGSSMPCDMTGISGSVTWTPTSFRFKGRLGFTGYGAINSLGALGNPIEPKGDYVQADAEL